MGKGICADPYVGNRELQKRFRWMFGGRGEYPWQIRQRLDRKKNLRRKPSATKK